MRRVPIPILLLGLLCFGVAPSVAAGSAAPATEPVEQAEQAIAAGNPQAALKLLARTSSGRGLLARSTAHFLLGDEAAGKRDLEKALSADPGLRQGWLNRAGLAIADGRFDDARSDLLKARELDPKASDNEINLGAVELMRGQLQSATEHFRVYLAAEPGATSHLLVSSNFARSGYAALAAAELRAAIDIDERSRARARTDPNFTQVGETPAFRQLFSEDRRVAPAGERVARQTFAVPYEIEVSKAVNATIDALRDAGEKVETLVETTELWSLVWAGTLRAKLEPDPRGGTLVSLSAPASASTGNHPTWEARAQEIFQRLTIRLAR